MLHLNLNLNQQHHGARGVVIWFFFFSRARPKAAARWARHKTTSTRPAFHENAAQWSTLAEGFDGLPLFFFGCASMEPLPVGQGSKEPARGGACGRVGVRVGVGGL